MKCKYCGLKAGFFSNVHKECEEKHKQGIAELFACIHSYFIGNDNISIVTNKIQSGKRDNFLSEEDIISCCQRGLSTFTDTIHLPITKFHLQKTDEFLNSIGISKASLNKDGQLDKLGSRLYQGVLMSYFVERLPLNKIEKRTQLVLSLIPLTNDLKEKVGLSVLDKAAGKFLEDGLISNDEQIQLDDFSHSLQLPTNNLPVEYTGSNIEKIHQAEILRRLQSGLPLKQNIINIPIMLTQGEFVIWTYNNICMYQEKITREWVGRHGGMSFRIMKGVYYRTGSSKGHPVERSSMENMGTGILILTNKNICFHTSNRSIKIPYKKIVGMTPYSDGIEIHQDGTKAQRQVFQGFDSWFMMNLLSNINI